MTDGPTPAPPSVGRMVARLAIAAAILALLDLAFWLTADFGSMAPPSDGVLLERLYHAGVTACGPLARLVTGRSADLGEDLWLTGGLAVLLAASIAGRRLALARLAGYLVVASWFFLGLCVSGLRIT